MTLHKTGSALRPIRVRISQEAVRLSDPAPGGVMWAVTAFVVSQRDPLPGENQCADVHVDTPEQALLAAQQMRATIEAAGCAAHIYRGTLPHAWAAALEALPRT